MTMRKKLNANASVSPLTNSDIALSASISIVDG